MRPSCKNTPNLSRTVVLAAMLAAEKPRRGEPSLLPWILLFWLLVGLSLWLKWG